LIKRQTEFVLDQMKLYLETAGSLLEHALKCNVYCTSGLSRHARVIDFANCVTTQFTACCRGGFTRFRNLAIHSGVES